MARLQAQPFRRCPQPKYPTKRAVAADPDLLRRHVPAGWLGSREIGGLLGMALAAQAGGCGDGSNVSAAGGVNSTPAVVAPLFKHGDGQGPGYGVLGCIIVAAPTFLAEEEAIQVIEDELAKAGLNLSQQNVAMPEVVISGHEMLPAYDWVNEWQMDAHPPTRGPLIVDRVDPAKRVAVEYVSEADYYVLGGEVEPRNTTDLRAVTDSVRREVGQRGPGVYFGAFYDPVAYYSLNGRNEDSGWADSPASAKVEAKRQLRAQVQDFVAWLKGQGAI